MIWEAYAAGVLGGVTVFLILVVLSGRPKSTYENIERIIYPTGNPPPTGRRTPKIRDDRAAIEMESKQIGHKS